MPDKDLELRLKATGGDAAAKEVRKVEEAVKDTAKAATGGNVGALGVDVSQLVPAWATAEEAVASVETATEKAAEAFDDLTADEMAADWLRDVSEAAGEANQSTGDLTATVGKMLGGANRFGPYAAIAAAAFKVGWEGARMLVEYLDEVEAASNRALPTLARTSQAAAVEAAALANATELSADRARDAEKAYDAYAKKLRQIADDQAALTDAELGATLAQIDLDQLQGRLTEAEAIQAKFDARRVAEAKKRATELAAIEEELRNRVQQNAFDLQRYQNAQGPARDAQGFLDMLVRSGARGTGMLDTQVSAVEAAEQALARNKDTDPQKLDELEKAVTDAQQVLADSYKTLVEDAIKKRDELVKVVTDAADTFNAGRNDERRLRDELANQTTGAGGRAFDAGQREADLRRQIELEKANAEARAAQEKAAADARAAQANADAARLAEDIRNQVANAPNGAADTAGLLPILSQVAQALQGGTNAVELAGLVERLANALAGLNADQSASRAVIQNLQAKLANLEGQLANRPER